MSEDIIFQRRNRLKNHFVNTSNVLLWCYQQLSDAARRLYQILDGFDYLDPELGTSKGYVYPRVETLAQIIGKDTRSVHRYLKELIGVKLITRVRRRNQSSVFVIEDINQEQIDLYIKMRKQLFSNHGGGSRGGDNSKSTDSQAPSHGLAASSAKSRIDKFVDSHEAPETTNLSIAYIEEEKEKKKNNVNVNENESVEKILHPSATQPPPNLQSPEGMTSMAELLSKYQPASTTPHLARTDDEQIWRRDAVANDLAQALNDEQSLGCYRLIATQIPQQAIFEALSEVKAMNAAGKINTTPGALFVYKIKQYAQDRGIDLNFAPT